MPARKRGSPTAARRRLRIQYEGSSSELGGTAIPSRSHDTGYEVVEPEDGGDQAQLSEDDILLISKFHGYWQRIDEIIDVDDGCDDDEEADERANELLKTLPFYVNHLQQLLDKRKYGVSLLSIGVSSATQQQLSLNRKVIQENFTRRIERIFSERASEAADWHARVSPNTVCIREMTFQNWGKELQSVTRGRMRPDAFIDTGDSERFLPDCCTDGLRDSIFRLTKSYVQLRQQYHLQSELEDIKLWLLVWSNLEKTYSLMRRSHDHFPSSDYCLEASFFRVKQIANMFDNIAKHPPFCVTIEIENAVALYCKHIDFKYTQPEPKSGHLHGFSGRKALPKQYIQTLKQFPEQANWNLDALTALHHAAVRLNNYRRAMVYRSSGVSWRTLSEDSLIRDDYTAIFPRRSHKEIDKEDVLLVHTFNDTASICCEDDAVSVPDADEVKKQANRSVDSKMLSNEETECSTSEGAGCPAVGVVDLATSPVSTSSGTGNPSSKTTPTPMAVGRNPSPLIPQSIRDTDFGVGKNEKKIPKHHTTSEKILNTFVDEIGDYAVLENDEELGEYEAPNDHSDYGLDPTLIIPPLSPPKPHYPAANTPRRHYNPIRPLFQSPSPGPTFNGRGDSPAGSPGADSASMDISDVSADEEPHQTVPPIPRAHSGNVEPILETEDESMGEGEEVVSEWPAARGTNILSAYDYVYNPYPENRAYEVANSRSISRDLQSAGTISRGLQIEDLVNLPLTHVRKAGSVTVWKKRTPLGPCEALKYLGTFLVRKALGRKQPLPVTRPKIPPPITPRLSCRHYRHVLRAKSDIKTRVSKANPPGKRLFVLIGGGGGGNRAGPTKRHLRPRAQNSPTPASRHATNRPDIVLQPSAEDDPFHNAPDFDNQDQPVTSDHGTRSVNDSEVFILADDDEFGHTQTRHEVSIDNSPARDSNEENIPQGEQAIPRVRRPLQELPAPRSHDTTQSDHIPRSVHTSPSQIVHQGQPQPSNFDFLQDKDPLNTPSTTAPQGSIRCHPCPLYRGQYHHICNLFGRAGLACISVNGRLGYIPDFDFNLHDRSGTRDWFRPPHQVEVLRPEGYQPLPQPCPLSLVLNPERPNNEIFSVDDDSLYVLQHLHNHTLANPRLQLVELVGPRRRRFDEASIDPAEWHIEPLDALPCHRIERTGLRPLNYQDWEVIVRLQCTDAFFRTQDGRIARWTGRTSAGGVPNEFLILSPRTGHTVGASYGSEDDNDRDNTCSRDRSNTRGQDEASSSSGRAANAEPNNGDPASHRYANGRDCDSYEGSNPQDSGYNNEFRSFDPTTRQYTDNLADLQRRVANGDSSAPLVQTGPQLSAASLRGAGIIARAVSAPLAPGIGDGVDEKVGYASRRGVQAHLPVTPAQQPQGHAQLTGFGMSPGYTHALTHTDPQDYATLSPHSAPLLAEIRRREIYLLTNELLVLRLGQRFRGLQDIAELQAELRRAYNDESIRNEHLHEADDMIARLRGRINQDTTVKRSLYKDPHVARILRQAMINQEDTMPDYAAMEYQDMLRQARRRYDLLYPLLNRATNMARAIASQRKLPTATVELLRQALNLIQLFERGLGIRGGADQSFDEGDPVIASIMSHEMRTRLEIWIDIHDRPNTSIAGPSGETAAVAGSQSNRQAEQKKRKKAKQQRNSPTNSEKLSPSFEKKGLTYRTRAARRAAQVDKQQNEPEKVQKVKPSTKRPASNQGDSNESSSDEDGAGKPSPPKKSRTQKSVGQKGKAGGGEGPNKSNLKASKGLRKRKSTNIAQQVHAQLKSKVHITDLTRSPNGHSDSSASDLIIINTQGKPPLLRTRNHPPPLSSPLETSNNAKKADNTSKYTSRQGSLP